MKCAGVYDRRFKELYFDRNAGCTTVKKLWENERNGNKDDQRKDINICCGCCEEYITWKQNHPIDQLKLKELANKPIYYRSHPEDKVKVVENGEEIEYIGTIYSTTCTKVAFTEGKHPFQCFNCYDLEHSYSLLQKLNRSKSLKYPRSDVHRATRVGVIHKYCSAENLNSALKYKVEEAKTQKQIHDRLTKQVEKLLSDDWHKNETPLSFLRSLHLLIVEKKLSDFDISFMENWVSKKAKGRYCRADAQARSLAVLYCNRLGQKTYIEVSPLLGLPGVRQVQRLKRKLLETQVYMPGINGWALQKAAMRENRPLQNSMDGTRVIRAIELYSDKYLVGEEFPADV